MKSRSLSVLLLSALAITSCAKKEEKPAAVKAPVVAAKQPSTLSLAGSWKGQVSGTFKLSFLKARVIDCADVTFQISEMEGRLVTIKGDVNCVDAFGIKRTVHLEDTTTVTNSEIEGIEALYSGVQFGNARMIGTIKDNRIEFDTGLDQSTPAWWTINEVQGYGDLIQVENDRVQLSLTLSHSGRSDMSAEVSGTFERQK